MITIDRTSDVQVAIQLIRQLRYLIAIGHFKVHEFLPPTRMLAEQTAVSFHTIRKAYQQLEREGLIDRQSSRRYRIVQRNPIDMSERMEQGASIVAESLQKLIGLGLKEQEIEYLLQEQLELVASVQHVTKVIFAAPYRELASLCAHQASMALQIQVEAATLEELSTHQDANHVIAHFPDLQQVMVILPRVDALGVVISFQPEGLEQIARLMPHETLGLMTQFSDAIEPLTKQLRTATGYTGQVIAASLDTDTQQISAVIPHTDFVAYTPSCQRRLLRILPPGSKHGPITPTLNSDSIATLRRAISA